MTLRPFSALLALLLALPLTTGCGKDKATPSPLPVSPKGNLSNKTPKDDGDMAAGEASKGNRPNVNVTAVGITEEFAKNPVLAEKRYKDKLIEVEGTVLSANQNSVRKVGGVDLVGAKTKRDDSLPLLVRCVMKDALVGRVGLLGKGQKVRVKGRFAGAEAGNVTLMEAEYEELTPSSVPRLTAEALAKEFAEDLNAAAKKYNEKDVILQGTILDLIEKDGSHSVKLAGNDKVRISGAMEEDEFKTLKKGDRIRIKGEVFLPVPGEVVIVSAFLVEKGS